MKNRIIAVFLSVLVGIGCFSSSVAFGSGVEVVDNILVDLFEQVLFSEDTWSGFADLFVAPVGSEEWKFRGRLNVSSKIKASGVDKATFEKFWDLACVKADFDAVEREFGVDVRDYIEHRSDEIVGLVMHVFVFWDSYGEFIDYVFGSSAVLNDDGNIEISSDEFKEEIKKQNQTLTPKNKQLYKYSWRELSNDLDNYGCMALARCVGKNGTFIDGATFADGVYLYPYFSVGDEYGKVGSDTTFYSPYQYHVYLDVTSGESFEGSQGERYPNNTYTWYYDALYYLVEDSEPIYTYSNSLLSYSSSFSNGVYNPAQYYFINFGFYPYMSSKMSFVYYNSQVDALSDRNAVSSGLFPANFTGADFISSSYEGYLKSDDVSTTYNFYTFYGYASAGRPTYNNRILSDFLSTYPNDDFTDYGILVSSEPFTTTYYFDVTRIPSNSTVTITGDTVYDYTITDNSTGDTTTIYNYYTNNYNYPDKEDSGNGSGSSGGSFSGDINVGGKVEVGGSVDVNVSVDISTGNGGAYGEMPDMSPLDGYLQNALEESSGIRGFLKQFFDFLPVEIIGLLGVLLTFVILARLLGR